MIRQPATRRSGYTLVEIIVVVAILILVGAVVVPTMTGMTGNTKVKGAADTVKSHLLEARLNAIDEGRPYVFSMNADGTKMRVAPDDTVPAVTNSDGSVVPSTIINDDLPTDIKISLGTYVANQTGGTTADGNTIIVTFQPDGTCTQDSPDILVQENNQTGVIVRVRGMTGAVSLNKPVSNQ